MSRPNILIIDDQPDDLAVFTSVLGEHLPDATIFCAGHVAQGFEVIAQHPPDVILLDVQLPRADGIEMCRKLKADPESAHIPVILIAAQGTEGHERTRGLDAGADDLLNKPVDNEELVARIRVALRVKAAEDALRHHLGAALAQRQEEQVLRQNAECLCRTAAAGNVGLWEWDLLGNRVYYSPEWKRRIGYDDSEISNSYDEWRSRVHPDDLQKMEEEIHEYFKNPVEHHETEFRLRHKDGSYRWILAQASVMRDADGKLLKMLGSHVDITGRKRVEEALRESERFAHATVDALSANIAVLDGQGTVVAVNRAWREFAAANPPLPPNAGEGANYLSVCDAAKGLDAEIAAPVAAEIRAILAGTRDTFEIEYPCHSPDTQRWFSCRVSRFPGPGATRVVVAHENITERKQVEQSLRESEKRYQRLTHAVTDYIYTVTIGEGGTVETVHGYGCEAVTGYRSEEFVANPHLWIEMVVAQDRELVNDLAQRLLAGKDVGPCEHRIMRKDGTVRWVRNTPSMRRDQTGKLLSYDGLISDITERKQAETRVRESEERRDLALDHAQMGAFKWNIVTGQRFWDKNVHRLLGTNPKDFTGTEEEFFKIMLPESRGPVQKALEKSVCEGAVYESNYRVIWPDGSIHDILARGKVHRGGNGRPERLVGVCWEVTAQKTAERRAQLRSEVLALLNGPSLDTAGMRQLLELLRAHTGADAVALRLRKGDDFPYVCSLGLSDEFVHDESPLCTYDAAGEAIRDRADRVALACLCGAVLRGELPQAACFTPHGSFLSGNLNALAKEEPEWLGNLDPRGRCLMDGFRSMALIPIRAGGETVGLIQLSQHKPEGFAAGEVEFLEELSESIGVAIARREAESALRNSEERYRALVSESPVAILVQTAEGIQYANPAVLKLLHLDSPMALVGRSLTELVHTDERGMMSDRVQQTLLERRPASAMTNRLVLADGTVSYVESLAIPIVFGGRPAVQVMATDITARRQAETALLVSEERFRRVFESSPLGVALVTRERKEFVRVNQRFCAITGYSCRELEQLTVHQIIHPDDLAHDASMIRSLTQESRPFVTFEHRFVRKDGTVVWVRATVTLMRDEHGESARYMALVEDISENRLLEEQLRQAQKMESLGHLAGGVAHDFNNQLAAIVGYSELIERRSTNPDLKVHARQVLKAASRSADLTRQLLAFARRGEYAAKPVDVRTILHDTLTVLKRTISRKIDVSSTFAEGPSLVVGDASLLSNAFFNLAINARDAMPDGGAIRFDADHVRLEPEQIKALGEGMAPGPHLRLRVQDTGHGMSTEVRLRIFEPFFTTKGEGKGTGLGLAAVYGTVKRHHGAIQVESAVGVGTTFTIYLPLAGAEEEAPAPTGPLPDLNAVRILSVDDEESVATVLRKTLEEEGCQVTVHYDGRAAVEYYKKNADKVDLVLLDMNMPKMDGLETLRAMRKIDAKVKVLIVTGQSDEAELRAALELGALGVVAKPFSRDQLVREMGRALGK